jgi:hypothetical protein
MKIGRDYAWGVSYSWTYEWLEEESGEWISDKDFEAERFYCNKKDIKKEAEKKAVESMDRLKYRNLEITINDCYKTTTEEI